MPNAFSNTRTSNYKWVLATTVLAAAVTAAGGTFSIAYPSGTNQAFFTGRHATTQNQMVVVNKNGNFADATISYGASTITVTNNSAAAWEAGSTIDVQLGYVDTDIGVPVTLLSAFSGVAAAGSIALAGAKVGQLVLGVVSTAGADAAASFESVITVADHIQQLSTSDLSGSKYSVILGQPS